MKVSYEGEAHGRGVMTTAMSSSSVVSKVHKRQLTRLDDSSVTNLTINDSMGPDTPSQRPGVVASGRDKTSNEEIYRYISVRIYASTRMQTCYEELTYVLHVFLFSVKSWSGVKFWLYSRILQ